MITYSVLEKKRQMEGSGKRAKTAPPTFGELQKMDNNVRVHVLERMDNLFYLFAYGRDNLEFRKWMKKHNVFERWFRYHMNVGFDVHVDKFMSSLIAGSNGPSWRSGREWELALMYEWHTPNGEGNQNGWGSPKIVYVSLLGTSCMFIPNEELYKALTKDTQKLFKEVSWHEWHTEYTVTNPHEYFFTIVKVLWMLSKDLNEYEFYKYRNFNYGTIDWGMRHWKYTVPFSCRNPFDVLSAYVVFASYMINYNLPKPAEYIWDDDEYSDEEEEEEYEKRMAVRNAFWRRHARWDFYREYRDIHNKLVSGQVKPLKAMIDKK